MVHMDSCQVQIASMMSPYRTHILNTLQAKGQPWLLFMMDNVHVDAWLSHPAEVLTYCRLATAPSDACQDKRALDTASQAAVSRSLHRSNVLAQEVMSRRSFHTEAPEDTKSYVRAVQQRVDTLHVRTGNISHSMRQAYGTDSDQGANAEHGGPQKADGNFSWDSLRAVREQLEAMCLSDESDESPAVTGTVVDIGGKPELCQRATGCAPQVRCTGNNLETRDSQADQDEMVVSSSGQVAAVARSASQQGSDTSPNEELTTLGFSRPSPQSEAVYSGPKNRAQMTEAGGAGTSGAMHTAVDGLTVPEHLQIAHQDFCSNKLERLVMSNLCSIYAGTAGGSLCTAKEEGSQLSGRDDQQKAEDASFVPSIDLDEMLHPDCTHFAHRLRDSNSRLLGAHDHALSSLDSFCFADQERQEQKENGAELDSDGECQLGETAFLTLRASSAMVPRHGLASFRAEDGSHIPTSDSQVPYSGTLKSSKASPHCSADPVGLSLPSTCLSRLCGC
jgi:hypothetical protein